jgi:TatA/E family protein of Tat protein translocase
MGPLGWQETVVIFILALLLFGPKKLPELGKTIGKAVTEFRRASNELKATFDREIKTLEQENDSLKDVTSNYVTDTHNYDYSQYDYGNDYSSGSDYSSGNDYSSSYGSEHDESTATDTSTESASATQGAESNSAATPEGTVAYGTEMAAATEQTADMAASETPASADGPAADVSSTTEQYKA